MPTQKIHNRTTTHSLFFMNSSRFGGSSERSPVTPVRLTQYTKPCATDAITRMRCSVVVGEISGMYEMPYLFASLLRNLASSGGRSTMMKPSTPATQAHTYQIRLVKHET